MSNREIDILSSLLRHLSYVITDGWQSCLCNNSVGFSFISVHATTNYIILLTLPFKNWRQKGTRSCKLMFGKWSGLNRLSGFYSGFSRMRSYYIHYTSSCGCGIETRGVRNDRRSVEESGLSIESWSIVQGVEMELQWDSNVLEMHSLLLGMFQRCSHSFVVDRSRFVANQTHCLNPENIIPCISSNTRHSASSVANCTPSSRGPLQVISIRENVTKHSIAF